MRFPLLWIGLKRRKSAPIIESEEAIEARVYDALLATSLEFGLMGDTHFFSSSAAEEARGGPQAVLRNSAYPPQHIDKVTVEPVCSSVTRKLVVVGD